MEVDPEREITVTCGATEAMAAVFLALIDPGDEVIVFEPFYENYGPDAILAERDAACSCRSRRPTGSSIPTSCARHSRRRRRRSSSTRRTIPRDACFTREEIALIAELCVEHDVIAITDEIYEHIRYAGGHHVLATWPGMRERTVTISGTVEDVQLHRLAPRLRDRAGARDASPIRKVHDFLTVGAPAPLQAAGGCRHGVRRRLLQSPLARLSRAPRLHVSLRCSEGGFKFSTPEGAYYVLADFSELSDQRATSSSRNGWRRSRRRDGAGLELLSRGADAARQ